MHHQSPQEQPLLGAKQGSRVTRSILHGELGGKGHSNACRTVKCALLQRSSPDETFMLMHQGPLGSNKTDCTEA